jgi:hypothetical protein
MRSQRGNGFKVGLLALLCFALLCFALSRLLWFALFVCALRDEASRESNERMLEVAVFSLVGLLAT